MKQVLMAVRARLAREGQHVTVAKLMAEASECLGVSLADMRRTQYVRQFMVRGRPGGQQGARGRGGLRLPLGEKDRTMEL